ncbi:MAG: GNAT family N-acetyltransferase [Pseudomonadota bacterium]
MRLFLRLKSLLGFGGRFDPSPAARRLPAATVREISAADHESCIDIYKQNESRFFPPDYLQFFVEELSSDSHLWLGIEEDGQLLAVGGIREAEEDTAAAALSFGMVRPDKQGMGYGSILLLARIASLPKPDPNTRIIMSSVEKSSGFHNRYGFAFVTRIRMQDGIELDHYYADVSVSAWEAARTLLPAQAFSFDPNDINVPRRPLGR